MTTTPPARAVLFDADGVLVDSHRAYRTVWECWARLHRLDAALVLAATHARRPVDTIAEVAPGLDPVAEHGRLTGFVAELVDGFPLFPGAADLLVEVPAGRWAVVTSGDATRVRARLTAGSAPLPTVLVDGHDVSRGKPDPEGFLTAAARLGSVPVDCLVVEDAPAGVRAAKAAGMAVLALTTSHDAGALAAADLVVASLTLARPHVLAWLDGGSLAA